MSQQQKTVTAHGEVEYETVECDSCGNIIPKEDGKRFVIGEFNRKDSWTHKGDELEFESYRMGWCCPFCETDPAGFPNTRMGGWFLDLHPAVQWAIAVALGVLLLAGLSIAGQAVV